MQSTTTLAGPAPARDGQAPAAPPAGAAWERLEDRLAWYDERSRHHKDRFHRLKVHEKFLLLAHAGPYLPTERPVALLAERVEGLVSQVHSAWASAQQEAGRRPEGRT